MPVAGNMTIQKEKGVWNALLKLLLNNLRSLLIRFRYSEDSYPH
jgi:hypothetical protein